MKVKLSLLDRKEVLHYSSPVEVAIYDKSYEIIGNCKVYKNDQGDHFGELTLDREVSDDLYFYYRSLANEGGIFIFSGLDLMTEQLEHSPAKKLKEIIVD